MERKIKKRCDNTAFFDFWSRILENRLLVFFKTRVVPLEEPVADEGFQPFRRELFTKPAADEFLLFPA